MDGFFSDNFIFSDPFGAKDPMPGNAAMRFRFSILGQRIRWRDPNSKGCWWPPARSGIESPESGTSWSFRLEWPDNQISWIIQGSYDTNPNNAQKIFGKSGIKFTIHLHCLISPKIGHFMTPIHSGQIIIFHQPRFPWNKGISLTKPPFGVRSCEVAIIWPDSLLWLQSFFWFLPASHMVFWQSCCEVCIRGDLSTSSETTSTPPKANSMFAPENRPKLTPQKETVRKSFNHPGLQVRNCWLRFIMTGQPTPP